MNTSAIILKKEQQPATAANITELVKTISDLTHNKVTTTISHLSFTRFYRSELRFYRRLTTFVTRHHVIAYMVAVIYVLTCLWLALIK